MRNRLYLQASTDGFLVSLYLIFIWTIILSPLGYYIPVYVTIVLDLVVATTLSYYYFKKISKISTKKEQVIFSLISLISFFVIISIFGVIKIYSPFYIIPKRELTAGDAFWVMLDAIIFFLSLFLGRFTIFCDNRDNQGTDN